MTGAEENAILNIVQYREVIPINKVVTSKEEILQACREIVSEEGLSAISMRAVAQRCHTAVGSLYYYFAGKDDLLLDTIESVWQDIFRMDHSGGRKMSFQETVEWIFESVRKGGNEYPNFFTAHSLGFASTAKGRARDTMNRYFGHMKSGMKEALKADPAVRKDAFSSGMDEEEFLDFVLTGILSLLLQQKDNCHVLTEMVRRTLY